MNSNVSIEIFRNNFFISLKEILSKDVNEKFWKDVLSHAEDEIVTEELYNYVQENSYDVLSFYYNIEFDGDIVDSNYIIHENEFFGGESTKAFEEEAVLVGKGDCAGGGSANCLYDIDMIETYITTSGKVVCCKCTDAQFFDLGEYEACVEVRKKVNKADPSFEIVAELFSDGMYDYFCK